MSYKARLVKLAINWTPKFLILWIANMKLKGVARLIDFSLDLDTRRAYVQTQLVGEADPIEVLVQGFAVVTDGANYGLIVQRAESNKPWLANVLSHIVRKTWVIPVVPGLARYLRLMAELLPPQAEAQ